MTTLHTLMMLPEPCTKMYAHIPHQMTLIGVHTCTVMEYLCPGWQPKEDT